MAKVLEGSGMGLMKKWGISVPHVVVVSSADQFGQLARANDWIQ
jgi:ATP-citrate lyase beta-subunit